MARTEKLTVAEAIAKAELIDRTMDAWDQTAPDTVAALGGRDALSQTSEMSCIGPVPRLEQGTWERASREYERRRNDALE